MKNVKEYFLEVFPAETPKFVNVINALPADKATWKPDPKSRTAIELASVIATELGDVLAMLDTGSFAYDPVHQIVFSSPMEAAAAFKTNADKVQSRIAGLSDADWEAKAAMMMDGKAVWETTRGGMAWGFLFDLIHHRGQLATYIRPMGGKVPEIYGPSADSAGEN
jgi:uncharacterized damage-inducible protein DinB